LPDARKVSCTYATARLPLGRLANFVGCWVQGAELAQLLRGTTRTKNATP